MQCNTSSSTNTHRPTCRPLGNHCRMVIIISRTAISIDMLLSLVVFKHSFQPYRYARNTAYATSGQWHGWNFSHDMDCVKLKTYFFCEVGLWPGVACVVCIMWFVPCDLPICIGSYQWKKGAHSKIVSYRLLTFHCSNTSDGFRWSRRSNNPGPGYSGYAGDRSHRSRTCCSGETTRHWTEGRISTWCAVGRIVVLIVQCDNVHLIIYTNCLVCVCNVHVY